jgi:hypothetical protein
MGKGFDQPWRLRNPVRQTSLQKSLSNLLILHIEVKKKSATNGESFWLRTVSTKLPALFRRHDRWALGKRNSPVIQYIVLVCQRFGDGIAIAHRSWES